MRGIIEDQLSVPSDHGRSLTRNGDPEIVPLHAFRSGIAHRYQHWPLPRINERQPLEHTESQRQLSCVPFDGAIEYVWIRESHA